MTHEELWNCNKPVNQIRPITVPRWIDQDITAADVAAICHGGCASGAYMPAVTYHTAREVMSEHGDDVLEFIEGHFDELPQPNKGESWSGMATFYLSAAVEIWAGYTLDLLTQPNAHA